MHRPSIFIGSSSEGLPVARAVKEQFDHEADVDIWNEGVFQMNASYLESLLRAANLYDFAVLVMTPDDLLTSRGKTETVGRDNVIFEHGLFLGRLGPGRAYIICEESVRILSDFAGITIATYRGRHDGNLVAAVGTACNKIRRAMKEQMERAEISFLPSTALAIGYYQNFVRKVNSALDDGGDIHIDGKPVMYKSFTLRIITPDDLSDVMPAKLKKRVKKLKQISLTTPFRAFPFYVRMKGDLITDGHLELFDIPTTLLASREAIELILPERFVGPSQDREKLEHREIDNFKRTIEYLLQREFGTNFNDITLESIDYLNTV